MYNGTTDPITSYIDYSYCVWGGSKRSNCLAIVGTTNFYGKTYNETGTSVSAVSGCVVCKSGYALS